MTMPQASNFFYEGPQFSIKRIIESDIEKHDCPACPRDFFTSAGLDRHIQAAHPKGRRVTRVA